MVAASERVRTLRHAPSTEGTERLLRALSYALATIVAGELAAPHLSVNRVAPRREGGWTISGEQTRVISRER